MRLRLFIILGLLGPSVAQAMELNGRLGAATDYIHRGLRLTQDDPAFHGMLEVTTGAGFYAGAWAGNVDFDRDDRDVEVNYFIGYSHRFGPDVALDTTLSRYAYLGDSNVDYDWTEWSSSAHLYDHWTISYALARDWYGQGRYTQAVEATYRRTAPLSTVFDISLGYHDTSSVMNEDYAYYGLGITRMFGSLAARLAVTGASNAARRVLPDRLAPASRLLAEISWSF